MVDIVRQYLELRPQDCDNGRFFLAYRNGKCTKQSIGINTIGNIPQLIAQFLELPNPKDYTGHCFRRSSSTILADSGTNLLTIKRHSGWKSNSVVEGYIENSSENKKRTAMKILGERENIPSTSRGIDIVNNTSINSNQLATSELSTSGVNLYSCKDCVIYVYNKN